MLLEIISTLILISMYVIGLWFQHVRLQHPVEFQQMKFANLHFSQAQVPRFALSTSPKLIPAKMRQISGQFALAHLLCLKP
jgi:hypothetical protein